jgi:two-component system chemotaxis response regulator CheY
MAGNVLIVKDSVTVRRMMKRSMQMADLSVDHSYEAANGIEAPARLADHDVDVTMVDINMPTMNGAGLLERMHDSTALKGTFVVGASAHGGDTRTMQFNADGIAGHIRKPFMQQQLRDSLEPILGARHDAGTENRDAQDDSERRFGRPRIHVQ